MAKDLSPEQKLQKEVESLKRKLAEKQREVSCYRSLFKDTSDKCSLVVKDRDKWYEKTLHWMDRFTEVQARMNELQSSMLNKRDSSKSPCVNCPIAESCLYLQIAGGYPLPMCLMLNRPNHNLRQLDQSTAKSSAAGPLLESNGESFPMDIVDFWNKADLSN